MTFAFRVKLSYEYRMSKLILLVHNEQDLAHLESAAQQIVDHGFTGVWVIHSPAIAADQETAAALFDKDIADLDAQVKLCGQREDFAGADAAKLARDAKKMDRAKALQDAWRSVPEADRPLIYAKKTEALRAAFSKNGISAKVNCATDHHDPADALRMLIGLEKVWFSPFTPGSYMIGWPGAFPTIRSTKIPILNPSNLGITSLDKATPSVMNIKPPVPEAAVKAFREEKAKAAAKSPLVAATNPDERRKQLTGMRFFALQSIAKKLSVEVKGRKPQEIVEAILNTEFAATA